MIDYKIKLITVMYLSRQIETPITLQVIPVKTHISMYTC